MQQGLSRFQVILMAIAAGVTVANLYYNQPILKEIALSFNISESRAGAISLLTQLGYGLGLFFITPLGDKLNRKNMILTLMSLLFFALILMAAAVNFTEVWILSILIGILSVSVHVIIPMAATIEKESKGKTIGIIFTGILIGILAARMAGGLIAELVGWRYIYVLSALLILSIGLILKLKLPDSNSEYHGHYLNLLGSALTQMKRFPLLRQTAITGALLFGVFCSMWTTLTFYLSGPPFNFHPGAISLFGFVAVAGIFVPPVFGRLADRGNTPRLLLLSISIVIAGLVLMKLNPDSVMILAVAVLILSIGLPANQVMNASIIFSLDETSHSRINTIYTTLYFIGGAFGTFTGLISWKYGGWNWVTWQMVILTLAASAFILKSVRELERERIIAA